MKPKEFSGTRVILVRHGDAEWNRLHRFQGWSDLPLNQKGNDQARVLTLALKEETITVIYDALWNVLLSQHCILVDTTL